MLSILTFLAQAAASCGLAWAEPTRTSVSPDGALRAIVIALPNAPYGNGETRVEIRDENDTLLFSHGFGSEDGEHGFGVVHAAWTPDSEFFVFSMTSSGGHQAWHFPTFVVSRRDKELWSIDELFGPVTQAGFKTERPDIVRTVGRRRDDLQAAKFRVHLSELREGAPANPRLQRPAAAGDASGVGQDEATRQNGGR